MENICLTAFVFVKVEYNERLFIRRINVINYDTLLLIFRYVKNNTLN